ncbi:MAG TPA: hypothetical protein VFB07_13000 [Vicinamibacterales bacterium]|nr:hypothetical protein [Vicinamibacterales bacterium]
MTTIRVTAVGIGLVAMCTAGLSAQTQDTQTNGDDRETTSRTEGTTGAFDQAYLGVHSIKQLSSSCR